MCMVIFRPLSEIPPAPAPFLRHHQRRVQYVHARRATAAKCHLRGVQPLLVRSACGAISPTISPHWRPPALLLRQTPATSQDCHRCKSRSASRQRQRDAVVSTAVFQRADGNHPLQIPTVYAAGRCCRNPSLVDAPSSGIRDLMVRSAAMEAARKEGEPRVIHMEVGQPDHATPLHILQVRCVQPPCLHPAL